MWPDSADRVLIAAGASAGHLYPAIAFAQRLVQLNPKAVVAFASSRRAQARERIRQTGNFEVFFVSIRPLSRGGVLDFLRFLYSLLKSFLEAFLIIEKFRPQAVVGFGAYVSLPLVLEASVFKRITIIHEQNVSLGRANRFLSPLVDRIAVSFRQRKFPHRKYVFTGNPLRQGLVKAGKREAADFFGLDEDKFTILVVGGSQGSRRINQAFKEAVSLLSAGEDFQFIHICGESDYSVLKKDYACIKIRHCLFDFLERMDMAYSLADLAVCRCGAGTISELAYFNKAAILVPYPYAGGHQRENALALGSEDAALVIEEKDLTGDFLAENILRLTRERDKLSAFAQNIASFSHPEAAKRLAEELFELLR